MIKLNDKYSEVKYRKIMRTLLVLCVLTMQSCHGMFLGGTGGKNIPSSNYITVSRISLKNGDVTTLTPQGWLNRALKGVGSGTIFMIIGMTL